MSGKPPALRPSLRAVSSARHAHDKLDAPNSVNERSGVVPRLNDFEHFVRVDRRGRVLTGHGQTEQLAALAAYACRIGDLMGQLLQFGPSLAVEATFLDGSVFAYRDGGGDVVGLKPHARVDLGHVRARLKL
jgi:hypothetical protein